MKILNYVLNCSMALTAITLLAGCAPTGDLSKGKNTHGQSGVSASLPPADARLVPTLDAGKETPQREAPSPIQAQKPETAQVAVQEAAPAVTKAIKVIYGLNVPSFVRELVQGKLTDAGFLLTADAGFLLTDQDDDRDRIVRITYYERDGEPYGIGFGTSTKSGINSRIASCTLTFTHSQRGLAFTNTCSAQSGAVSGNQFTIGRKISESVALNLKTALSQHQFWLRLAALRSKGNKQDK